MATWGMGLSLKGADGQPGADGAPGVAGEPGKDAPRGVLTYTGQGAPSNDLTKFTPGPAQAGDLYYSLGGPEDPTLYVLR